MAFKGIEMVMRGWLNAYTLAPPVAATPQTTLSINFSRHILVALATLLCLLVGAICIFIWFSTAVRSTLSPCAVDGKASTNADLERSISQRSH